MTDDEVVAKSRRLVEPRYGKERADRMLDRCWEFEKVTRVNELLELFDARSNPS